MKRAKTRARFVVCVKNKGYEASLELCKLYRLVPDPVAEQRGYLRFIHGEPRRLCHSVYCFRSIELPKPLERALLKAAS